MIIYTQYLSDFPGYNNVGKLHNIDSSIANDFIECMKRKQRLESWFGLLLIGLKQLDPLIISKSTEW